ncbi:HAMP domain-containing histidine kinase [Kribbella antibiotica]|uniref:histidine kinase n=1 Tax=Kribbella antibiotica TaxID=190195 RepID=A0A4R4ZTE7_9ACTN|nr:HAMP domain-containing sensor histidine kinase [Kribbella antibiotica]TDD62353.1 HAMP domain-containing histidine kinase [Kribbella antibiotica]
MRRSLLIRFLGLSLAVALGAVLATAVIATYSTREKLQGEIDANTGQLQSDGQVYAELSDYAMNHPSWSGVDKEVRRLADETGRRIALLQPDGTVIADSARMLGAAPELPSVPAATIDARDSGGAVFAGTSGIAAARSTAVPMMPMATVTRASFSYYDAQWGLSDSEKEQRKLIADEANRCYQAIGSGASISLTAGRPLLAMNFEASDGASVRPSAPLSVESGGTPDPCYRAELYAPSAKAKLVNDDQVRRASDCLTATGVPFRRATSADGLQVVTALDGYQDMDGQFNQCATTAQSQAITPYVAPQAKLYLGSASTFNVFSGEGMLRTAATALGVMLIAAVVMLLTGRRLVRPIVALTGAAQRMRNGDHAARVPVTGKDEVARLGHAFNAMAESIQRADFQRKAMVSDVAHELRTPLANIKGYLVASEDGVVPLDAELVTSLLEETSLLEHLVADLQDLALADAGMLRLHPAPRDLSELAQQVVLAHRPAAETAGVALTANVPAEAVASVDSSRMRQALGNLVSNAIRFTPTGGTVVVGVRRVPDGYNLTVTDNGAGIAEKHLPHLFDRFYRAEQSRSRSTGGSGLGLAITKHLAEAHRGRITVTSKLGEGSVFTLWIPADPR